MCLIVTPSFHYISFSAKRFERPNVQHSPIWNAGKIVTSTLREACKANRRLMCDMKILLFLRDLTPPPLPPTSAWKHAFRYSNISRCLRPVSYTEMRFEHVTREEVTWKHLEGWSGHRCTIRVA